MPNILDYLKSRAGQTEEEQALTRYANTLTGASDQTLIEAAETLITDRIKEDK